MKTFIFSICISLWGFAIFMFLLLVLAFGAHAEPFLASQPQTNIDEYIIVMDESVHVTSLPQDLGDGTVRLHYDLAGLSDGEHHFEVKARNVWGDSETVPFDLNKALPASPTGVYLSAD